MDSSEGIGKTESKANLGEKYWIQELVRIL